MKGRTYNHSLCMENIEANIFEMHFLGIGSPFWGPLYGLAQRDLRGVLHYSNVGKSLRFDGADLYVQCVIMTIAWSL